MRHPESTWADPTYASEPICDPAALARPERRPGRQPARVEVPLGGAAGEWLLHLGNRPRPTTPETIRKYRNSVLAFARSVADAGEEPVLGALTRFAVDRWVSQQRLAGRSSEGIASRLAALKAFTRSYLHQEAEYTRVDLLEKVRRPKPEETAKPMLDDEERAAIFDALDRHGGYEDTRNAAFIAALLSTGLRYKAVLELDLGHLDVRTGVINVVEKGGVERPAQLSPGAMKLIRRWLRVRRAGEGVAAVWTTQDGQALSYWGGRSFFARLKKRSGVTRLHPHLLRHTFGQGAIVKGATPGEVQDMLGHKTAAMTQRYTKTVRASAAAAKMPRYALV